MSPEHEWTKKQSRSLVEDVQEYFDLELATTKAQLTSIFQVRYRVYCEEFGYEPLEAFTDCQETDEMEPFLPRLLKRSGLLVHAAGDKTDYHGVRAPYFFETHEAVGGLQGEMQEFYQAKRSSFGVSGARAVSPLRSF
jgi:hypothetical protein